jgi:GntR family transcriptional regulator, trigonelline degradation regulator
MTMAAATFPSPGAGPPFAPDSGGTGAADRATHDLPAFRSVVLSKVAAPLRDQVIEALRNAIAELRLLPGQRLVERELAVALGASRTTIREALQHLAADGLVMSMPPKGSVVTFPSASEVAEIYEIRGYLEGIIARDFARRATSRQLEELRIAFVSICASRQSGDLLTALLAKNAFYRILRAGALNRTVAAILGRLEARIAVLRAVTFAAPGRSEESTKEIADIIATLEARDGAAACQAVAIHVGRAGASLARRLGFDCALDEITALENGEQQFMARALICIDELTTGMRNKSED